MAQEEIEVRIGPDVYRRVGNETFQLFKLPTGSKIVGTAERFDEETREIVRTFTVEYADG